MVQPRADAVEHRRHMLAHAGPIRTTARERDLMGRREKARFLPANPFHDALREPALQKLDERIDGAGAVRADGSPARLFDRRHPYRYLVNFRTADQGFDLAGRDLKIDYGTVADIGPAARQAVGKVAVLFQVLAPGLAPEGLDDGAAFHHHRRDRMAFLLELGHRFCGFLSPFGNGDIGSPSAEVHRSRLLQRFVDVERYQLE